MHVRVSAKREGHLEIQEEEYQGTAPSAGPYRQGNKPFLQQSPLQDGIWHI